MSRRRRALAGIVTTAIIAAVVTTSGIGPAGATGDGGATTRVVGRGDIITSILGWSTGRSGGRGGSVGAPRCVWRTLTDAQIEWVVAVAGQGIANGLSSQLIDPLRPYLDGGELPDGDLQGYVCGAGTYELRFAPTSVPRTALQVLYRQMITRLPAPEPRTTPPPSAVVPVGQPVFFSIDRQHWRPLEATLRHDGLVAEVRAEPVGLRIITGEPTFDPVSCDGPGTPFRPETPLPAALQARGPAACTVAYRTASDGGRSPRSGVDGLPRPVAWLGTVTVLWSARWRIGTGEWTDLGLIPRTRLIARSTRELTTSIESRR